MDYHFTEYIILVIIESLFLVLDVYILLFIRWLKHTFYKNKVKPFIEKYIKPIILFIYKVAKFIFKIIGSLFFVLYCLYLFDFAFELNLLILSHWEPFVIFCYNTNETTLKLVMYIIYMIPVQYFINSVFFKKIR